MTAGDIGRDAIHLEAERLAQEQKKIDEKNRRRRAKGRNALPDIQEQKDIEFSRRIYRTGDNTTVDAADALKLFEMRKNEADGLESDDIGGGNDIEDEQVAKREFVDPRKRQDKTDDSNNVDKEDATSKEVKSTSKEEDDAIRIAEAARSEQDRKCERIDHTGNWSVEGQELAGGDKTTVITKASKATKKTPTKDNANTHSENDKHEGNVDLTQFRDDLYKRMGVSFEALESTLSDVQGRVSEILRSTQPQSDQEAEDKDGRVKQFYDFISQKTPVTFLVEGTQMTSDAICVFHAPPCITIVSKEGSAKIIPRPGAQIHLTYEMDGKKYVHDPVTFLGTRFDIPVFGLSFIGFIRDLESDMMDVADTQDTSQDQ